MTDIVGVLIESKEEVLLYAKSLGYNFEDSSDMTVEEMKNEIVSFLQGQYPNKPFTFSQIDSWSHEDWSLVSERVKLAEEFIRKYQDKVDWKEISIHQILSEDFIAEFQDKVDWEEILLHQKLSKSFMEEFKHKF